MIITNIIAPLLRAIFFLGAPANALGYNNLKPWEISRLGTFSPSGRPGSSPWSVINITISDPNARTVTPTICSAQWTWETPPWDQVQACTEDPHGEWSFVMVKSADSDYPSPTTDFVLRFTLVLQGMHRQFLGVARFRIGENMSGLCAASGFCSFGLKEELVPFLVNQTLVPRL